MISASLPAPRASACASRPTATATSAPPTSARSRKRSSPASTTTPTSSASARNTRTRQPPSPWPTRFSRSSFEGGRHEAPRLQILRQPHRGNGSRDLCRHHRRGTSPAEQHRAHRLGKFRLARRDGGAGLAADQQVCRRLSRQALVWRLRKRRRRRATRHRPRQAALRSRARERPAALRLAGEHRRLFLRPQARRQDPHHGPRPRRPPHPRPQGEFLRHVSTTSPTTA